MTFERKWNPQFDLVPFPLPALIGSRKTTLPNNAGTTAIVPTGETEWGQVSGVILDRETGDALPGVNVILEGTMLGAATNEHGRFRITRVPPGLYQISTSMIGYVKAMLAGVMVHAGYETQLYFDLTAASIGGAEVVIVAERPLFSRDQTMTMTVTSSEDIKNLPVRGFSSMANLGMGIEFDNKEELPQGQRPSIATRRRFEETALWIPAAVADSSGAVHLKWTMPDALTRWRFQAFAHSDSLQIGTVELEVQAQKKIMAQLFTPRFVRAGDTIDLRGRLVNMSDSNVVATVTMIVRDSITGQIIIDETHPVMVGASQTAIGRWALHVPERSEILRYDLLIQTSEVSDAEAGVIHVLSSRETVTEAQTFTLNDSGLFLLTWNEASADSSRGRRILAASLQLENPVWKILSSLPYLAEFPHECSEQVFARWFAAVTADFLFSKYPELKLNYDLADSTLDDYRRIELESLIRLRKNSHRLKEKSFAKLLHMQSSSGAWPWFPGMADDITVTSHIVSGLRHVRRLGIKVDTVLVDKTLQRGLDYLDREVEREVRTWEKKPDRMKIMHARYLHYLYAQSGIKRKANNAADHLMAQGRANWLHWPLHSQAYFALSCHRARDTIFSKRIMESIRERATVDSAGNMYWPSDTMVPGWYGNPIETQSLLIEAFAEIMPDRGQLTAMLQWLLKQKRTSHWPTTKATSEACFVLLQYGPSWKYGPDKIRLNLPADRELDVHAGVTPSPAVVRLDEALDTLSLTRSSQEPLWGSWIRVVEDDLENYSEHGQGLNITRSIFVFRHDKFVDVRDSVSLAVGEKLLIRLTIEAGQDVDFVHIVDGRSSGIDPGIVLSGYKFKNGVGYYESPRDEATHFYVRTIKKGKSIIEYPAQVTHSGIFLSGLASAASMYAPDYRGHSRSLRLIVRK